MSQKQNKTDYTTGMITRIHHGTVRHKNRHALLYQVIMLFACILTIFFINKHSVITFAFFLAAIGFLQRFIPRNRTSYQNLMFSFIFYTVIMLAIFLAQLYVLPDWDGLSGPEGGIGTDDCFFYSQATDDLVFSRNGAARAVWSNMHHYSLFLRGVASFIRIFYTPHLLDLLILNTFALAFIPILCSLCIRTCFPIPTRQNRAMETTAFWLAMIYPNFWANGLILIRDGWTATLFILAIYLLLKLKLHRYILVLAVLSFFRMASAISLVACSIPIAWPTIKQKTKKYAPVIMGAMGVIALGTVAVAVLSGYVQSKNISFMRGDYVQGFMAKAADQKSGTSILYTISNLPFYMRIPLSFIFFMCAPFVNLHVVKEGIFVPRYAIASITGILNIILIKYWTQSFVTAYKKWRYGHYDIIIHIHLAYITGIFLVSTMSLQMRHKTMLIPLLCIVAAHGSNVSDINAKRIGNFAMLFLLSINMASIVLRM